MDFLHAETGVVKTSAQATGVSAQDILGQVNALVGEKDAFLAQTMGLAATTFSQVFDDWVADVRLVVNRVINLADNTNSAAEAYNAADETSRQVIAMSAGPGVAAAINPHS